jgi:hypothetical protein
MSQDQTRFGAVARSWKGTKLSWNSAACPPAQFVSHEAVQAHPGLGRPDSKLSMGLGSDADNEFAAIVPICKRLRDLLVVFPEVFYDLSDQRPNTL